MILTTLSVLQYDLSRFPGSPVALHLCLLLLQPQLHELETPPFGTDPHPFIPISPDSLCPTADYLQEFLLPKQLYSLGTLPLGVDRATESRNETPTYQK